MLEKTDFIRVFDEFCLSMHGNIINRARAIYHLADNITEIAYHKHIGIGRGVVRYENFILEIIIQEKMLRVMYYY